MLYNAKGNEEEASSWHEGELSSSDLSESSDDKYEYEDITCAKDINDNGDGGGDRNTGARGESAEWLGLISLGAKTEA